jgi:hypothetical protein
MTRPQLISATGRLHAFRGETTATIRPERWQAPAQKATAILQPRYQPGMHVNHPAWGEGLVLNSQVDSDDEIVDVFFEGIGLKHVAASLARLEIKPQ